MQNLVSTEAASVIAHRIPIAIFSFMTIISGLIQIGIGVSVYVAVTNVRLGAWWAGTFCTIAAFLCLAAKDRCTLIWGCVFSSISVVLALAGSIGDGFYSELVGSLTACVDKSGKAYGASEVVTAIETICKKEADCQCLSSASDLVCNYYNGPGPKSGCDFVLNDWESNLRAAAAFDSITLILVFCLSITACVSLCCSHSRVDPNYGEHVPVGVPTNAVIVGASGPVMYGQQGAVYGGIQMQATTLQPQYAMQQPQYMGQPVRLNEQGQPMAMPQPGSSPNHNMQQSMGGGSNFSPSLQSSMPPNQQHNIELYSAQTHIPVVEAKLIYS